MKTWLHNVWTAIATVSRGMAVTARTLVRTYRRPTFTEAYEYPEMPVPVAPRYRGFHRFDLTTCIGCEKCLVACPVDCIYIDKKKAPVGKGFQVDGFTIDYSKCMFCALCVDPCPVDCIFMGSSHDLSCYSRDGVLVDFAKLPLEVAWGRTSLTPQAVAASKEVAEPVWVRGEENLLWPDETVDLDAEIAKEKAAAEAKKKKAAEAAAKRKAAAEAAAESSTDTANDTPAEDPPA